MRVRVNQLIYGETIRWLHAHRKTAVEENRYFKPFGVGLEGPNPARVRRPLVAIHTSDRHHRIYICIHWIQQEVYVLRKEV